jgi:hypothetical protein
LAERDARPEPERGAACPRGRRREHLVDARARRVVVARGERFVGRRERVGSGRLHIEPPASLGAARTCADEHGGGVRREHDLVE